MNRRPFEHLPGMAGVAPRKEIEPASTMQLHPQPRMVADLLTAPSPARRAGDGSSFHATSISIRRRTHHEAEASACESASGPSSAPADQLRRISRRMMTAVSATARSVCGPCEAGWNSLGLPGTSIENLQPLLQVIPAVIRNHSKRGLRCREILHRKTRFSEHQLKLGPSAPGSIWLSTLRTDESSRFFCHLARPLQEMFRVICAERRMQDVTRILPFVQTRP